MNHLVQEMTEQEKTQFRAIQNRCERQWRKVREAKSETARNILYGQMVVEIGDVLGVEVTDHDLDPYPEFPARFVLPNELTRTGFWEGMKDQPLVTYDPRFWGFTHSPSFERSQS